ncbi:hypothetical protein AAEU29_18655 [Pseudoalteromonas sp. SSM20]|uniref:hypothetical protein n=1 Tax=Pseudoalteromonas sp. SSM20 TaxID=3139394 RepID=UPI003BACA8EB
MDKYLAGWHNENEQWRKARKKEWKLVEAVVDCYSPRDKEERAKLKDFFLTGNLDFNNYNGFRIEFLKEDDQEVKSNFDCALDGIHGRVFLLMLFSPIQTEEMYRYIIEQVKKRKDEIWQIELQQARECYLECAGRYHSPFTPRIKDELPLAGREKLLFKFLHGEALENDIQFELSKDKKRYVQNIANDFLVNSFDLLISPYPSPKHYYNGYSSYLRSIASYIRTADVIEIHNPDLALTASIYCFRDVLENKEQYLPIKIKVAEDFTEFVETIEDYLPERVTTIFAKAHKEWDSGQGKEEWQKLKQLVWADWSNQKWVNKRDFDKFGKPKNGDLQ